ncbi:MAG TPA: DUF1592 domain-containing protein [Polyangiales bacterium]|nr:DUF1592 domain-containing protein [Polyangiales bacterium]
MTNARAPLRRLTSFEYDNSVRDLLGDDSSPARAFPSEEIGNGFGNDADAQGVSSLLAEQYATVAEAIAQRATATPAALARLDACTQSLTAASEPACARKIVDRLGTSAFRRPLARDEGDELYALYAAARTEAPFAAALATVIEAIVQAPDFLYRVELGVADAAQPGRRRVSGDEMATRLSYLLWQTLPDESLRLAAARGELATAQGVSSHARRMLDDPRSRPVVRYFFDNLLPIASLTQLERDRALYPDWNAEIGRLMHEETQTFLEHEIWSGPGTWPAALTAPYTYVNEALAKFYGIPGVKGAAFQKVPLDPTRQLGVLTQGAFLAGTTASNHTNPVIRGAFIARELLCRPLALPSDPALLAMIKPPDPYSAKTARERYAAHRTQPVCAGCHQQMDPIGLTFENFDPVGRYRTTENGAPIDASGELPGAPGTVRNAVGLVQALAALDETHACFATRMLEFGYGRSLKKSDASDACLQEQIQAAFKASGYDIKQLLLDLTQTEAFLYLRAP